jgi:hypothetical protein
VRIRKPDGNRRCELLPGRLFFAVNDELLPDRGVTRGGR